MKQRISGRVNRDRNVYEVVSPAGDVMKEVPLSDAPDSKTLAAIERNGWEQWPIR
jgi:hypothetical protein